MRFLQIQRSLLTFLKIVLFFFFFSFFFFLFSFVCVCVYREGNSLAHLLAQWKVLFNWIRPVPLFGLLNLVAQALDKDCDKPYPLL